MIGTDTAPSDASVISDGHTNDHPQNDTDTDGTAASDATTSSETTEIDLQGVTAGTYPEDLVENGARWLLWQYSDDREVPRNLAWGYSDHGAGYAFAGAKDPRA